ncbi:hypothetical protein Adt_48430 [Abeliophyllum distichum]|uniref:Uncharacterized protein n=1 Tax=Abeliophyllum distichum TaxID=126358 RepID=A0ABD1NR51_9LAMI
MPLHVFQTVYHLRKLSKKKGKNEELGWYYFCPWGTHKPLVTDCPSSVNNTKKKAVEVVDNYTVYSQPPLQQTLSVTATGEVNLDLLPKVPQSSGGSDGGLYDLKRKLRELIGPHGARIPNDVVRNLHFYPAMGMHAFKKYFNPRWKDFTSHGDLEDAL